MHTSAVRFSICPDGNVSNFETSYPSTLHRCKVQATSSFQDQVNKMSAEVDSVARNFQNSFYAARLRRKKDSC